MAVTRKSKTSKLERELAEAKASIELLERENKTLRNQLRKVENKRQLRLVDMILQAPDAFNGVYTIRNGMIVNRADNRISELTPHVASGKIFLGNLYNSISTHAIPNFNSSNYNINFRSCPKFKAAVCEALDIFDGGRHECFLA